MRAAWRIWIGEAACSSWLPVPGHESCAYPSLNIDTPGIEAIWCKKSEPQILRLGRHDDLAQDDRPKC